MELHRQDCELETGPVDDSENTTWDTDSGTWDDDATPWNSTSASLNRTLSLMASEDQKLFLLDSTYTNDGAAITSVLERKGLSLGEPEAMKLIRGVRPRIYGDNGYVNVQVGYGNTPYEEPTYNTAVPFYVNSTVAVDSFVTGRYMAIKFTNGTATNWRLDSYDVDVQKAGNW